MATIEYVKDTAFSVDGAGNISWQRKMMLFGDSLMEIMNGVKIPQVGSRHPHNARLRLSNSSCNEVGNINGKCQALWEGTYTTNSSDLTFDDREPWELGAQDLASSPFDIEEALTYHYSADDFRLIDEPPRNSAGSALEIKHNVYGREYSFKFCKKAKSDSPYVNLEPIINSGRVKVADLSFERGTALLMPIKWSHVVDQNAQREDRSYFELSVVIRHNPRGWIKEALNIGTLAKPRDLPDYPLEAIFRYTPWTSEAADEKHKTKPKFGTLADVVAAKHAYANKISQDGYKKGGEAATKYWNAWQELPYQEVTEAVPLNEKGEIFTEAMTDPSNNPYKKVRFSEYAGANWSQYDLPSKKER